MNTRYFSQRAAQAPYNPNQVEEWELLTRNPETSGLTLDKAWALAKYQSTYSPKTNFGVLGLANGIARHANALPATLNKIAMFYGNPSPTACVPTLQAIAAHPAATVETLHFLISNYNKDVGIAVLMGSGWNKLKPFLTGQAQKELARAPRGAV